MAWTVLIDEAFADELADLDSEVSFQLAAMSVLLAEFGPRLGRPRADTLKGSKHSNMKELRFEAADGVWRVAFAFDPIRSAVLLVAGDKSGVSEKRFYKKLIETADNRFDAHLRALKRGK
ncbi:type II toxin-antitoxin system RelE/ParE family toxin [Rhizobium sp. LjRoot254]|uniref:type II toxin-antitoxin system RelE/ParE family toxin n=1 Tax=Rhizobium sp. LjRoot254 TaxID=3342297 RepID=UPI003ED043D3